MPQPKEPEAGPVVARMANAIEDGVKAAVEATTRRWGERPGTRTQRLRRLARNPLAFLYDVHPEARQASPHELGIQAIAVADIAGTAVGPPGQRGRDFLPLPPFRSRNWSERWRRVRAAVDRMAILPPIDVQRFSDKYWVLDGHNRVAAALYVGQRAIDANVVELVPAGGTADSAPASLANVLAEHAELQAALSRRSVESSDDPG